MKIQGKYAYILSMLIMGSASFPCHANVFNDVCQLAFLVTAYPYCWFAFSTPKMRNQFDKGFQDRKSSWDSNRVDSFAKKAIMVHGVLLLTAATGVLVWNVSKSSVVVPIK